jgi:hypothetical protein
MQGLGSLLFYSRWLCKLLECLEMNETTSVPFSRISLAIVLIKKLKESKLKQGEQSEG